MASFRTLHEYDRSSCSFSMQRFSMLGLSAMRVVARRCLLCRAPKRPMWTLQFEILMETARLMMAWMPTKIIAKYSDIFAYYFDDSLRALSVALVSKYGRPHEKLFDVAALSINDEHIDDEEPFQYCKLPTLHPAAMSSKRKRLGWLCKPRRQALNYDPLIQFRAPSIAFREIMDICYELIPWDIKFQKVSANGVPAEWITRGRLRPDESLAAPLILYLHGGAFVMWSIDSHRGFLSRIASACRPAKILAINYRLTPEHCFPAALQDAFAAYQFMISSERLLHPTKDPKVFIMGDSSGGNLTFALLLCLRDLHQRKNTHLYSLYRFPSSSSVARACVPPSSSVLDGCRTEPVDSPGHLKSNKPGVLSVPLALFSSEISALPSSSTASGFLSPVSASSFAPIPPMPAAVVGISPWLNLHCSHETWHTNKPFDYLPHDPFLTIPLWYLGTNNRKLLSFPLVSPFFGDFRDCPPILLQVGTAEALWGECQQFYARLQREGLQIELQSFPDMTHAFPFFPMAPYAKQAVASLAQFVRAVCCDEMPKNVPLKPTSKF